MTAPEAVVALVFLCSEGTCYWCKSEWNGGEMEIRLALFPYDQAHVDVQVNFSVGQGQRLGRTVVSSPEYVPAIAEASTVACGQFAPFTRIAGSPPADLSVLFIARHDVEFGRNGLWRVRKQIAESLDEPSRRMLTYGRTGEFPE